jgi:hypothetical protein
VDTCRGPGAGQADGLILDDVPVLRHCVFLDDLEEGIVFHAGDEIDAGIGPFGEQPVVVVSPIIHDDGVGRKVPVMGGPDVGHLAIGDEAKARQPSWSRTRCSLMVPLVRRNFALVRGINVSICLNRLHDAFTLGLLR